MFPNALVLVFLLLLLLLLLLPLPLLLHCRRLAPSCRRNREALAAKRCRVQGGKEANTRSEIGPSVAHDHITRSSAEDPGASLSVETPSRT